MAGDTETGVVIMRMEEGLDTGSVSLWERMPIGPDMTAGELHDELSLKGARLIGQALDLLPEGQLRFRAQRQDGVTYANECALREAGVRPGELRCLHRYH